MIKIIQNRSFIVNLLRYLPRTLQQALLYQYDLIGFKKAHVTATLQPDFPIKKKDGSFLFHKPLFGNDVNEGYFTQYYDEPEIPQVFLTIKEKLSLKTETLKGRLYSKGQQITLDIKSESVLPISLIKKNFEGSYIEDDAIIKLRINNKKIDLKGLAINRFHYIPIPGKSKVSISSNHDFIVGEAFPKKQKRKHKKKLVLVLFIDGFAAQIFQKVKLKELMPYTYNFFKKGIIFNNGYCSSKWTLPNLASMFSGKYTKNHGVFHPHKEVVLGKNYPVISDYLKNNGYMTLHIESGWRLTPSYGYCKGFDRTIYKKSLEAEEIIDGFTEHLQTFKDRDNFAWLSFMDLHHDLNLLPDLDVQVNTPIKFHDYTSTKIKSAIIRSFDEKKTYKYIKKLTNLDFKLREIYDYIERNYKNDEVLVCLISDHGQGYIGNSKTTLSKTRTRVPFMIRGYGKSNIETEELFSNLDLLPTLLHILKIKHDKGSLDGVLPKIFGGRGRDYVLVETIYPGETYTATIKDKEDEFYFETENTVGDDGKVNAVKYKVQIVNSKAGSSKQRKLKKYTNIVLKHLTNKG